MMIHVLHHAIARQTQTLHLQKESQLIEQSFENQLPPHELMRRAGSSIASWIKAIKPHARHIWFACGPGNNGGDGLLAASLLASQGIKCSITHVVQANKVIPDDAFWALKQAQQSALCSPLYWINDIPADADVWVDALLGLGSNGEPRGEVLSLLERMHLRLGQLDTRPPTLMAIDLPTGLNGDTGVAHSCCIKANCTLSLLTLKPGLFTANGRDASGDIWFDDLSCDTKSFPGCAFLNPPPRRASRPHASHKGCWGNVMVVGGSSGMEGAAHLAGLAALHAGAGKVWLVSADGAQLNSSNARAAELMTAELTDIPERGMTLVCGCGGGQEMAQILPNLLATNCSLILDADALNAIANSDLLMDLLRQRTHAPSVITPHPLEASRLLGIAVEDVQNNRLEAAKSLAQKLQTVVVLKGSGTLIQDPLGQCVINSTGNAKLATAGSGDVLAGMIGAYLANQASPFDAACKAVYVHGQLADDWTFASLTASHLAKEAYPVV